MSIEIKKSIKPVKYDLAINYLEYRVKEIISKKSEKELIWFLEHPSIFTGGSSFKKYDILDNSIKITKTSRGGKITWHGPGQLVCYFVIDLNKRKRDIRSFISIIEKSLIIFLNKYNIYGLTFKERVGIWVNKVNNKKLLKEEKIGAIGLRLKKWITFHGLSFNINPDLEYYKYINACGLVGYNNTSLKKLGFEISAKEFDEKFCKIFLDELNNFN